MRRDRSPAAGIACFAIAVAVAACGGDPAPAGAQTSSSSGGAPMPLVTVAPNPESVCSAIVGFVVPGASTAIVMAKGGNDSVKTPPIHLDDAGRGTIAILGLAASTPYEIAVEAQVAGATTSTAPVAYTTPPLPAELAGVRMAILQGTGAPSTAYYLVEGSGSVAFAVDGEGVVRWYHELDGAAGETKMQPDGTFTTFVGATEGFQPLAGEYTRYAPDGARLATYTATSPDTSEQETPAVYTDDHELQITKDANGGEHVHLIGYEIHPVSATSKAPAAWHQIQRQSPDGAVEFQWSVASRFTSADTTEPLLVGGLQDVDHMNALSFDPSDGNYIASLRDLDAVVKIDATTGEVLWQVGGAQATMTILGDPLTAFYGQHDAHLLANGHLLVYDNGIRHTPLESRAAEYALDPVAKTATLVWEYRNEPPIYTKVVGSATRLSDGNTVVAFAEAGRVVEVDPNGEVVWRGQLLQGEKLLGGVYRVRPLTGLYAYAVP